MLICSVLLFALSPQLLTEKLIAELRLFNETAEKEKEALQVRLTLFQVQPGTEHLLWGSFSASPYYFGLQIIQTVNVCILSHCKA